jgi:hypothetical protein
MRQLSLLRDKRILVTRVSAGLGAEIARSLLRTVLRLQARHGKSSFRALCRIVG